jgi:hypothetical protein
VQERISKALAEEGKVSIAFSKGTYGPPGHAWRSIGSVFVDGLLRAGVADSVAVTEGKMV